MAKSPSHRIARPHTGRLTSRTRWRNCNCELFASWRPDARHPGDRLSRDHRGRTDRRYRAGGNARRAGPRLVGRRRVSPPATLGACLVAAFAGELAALFSGSGQELFNATVLVLAVGMLTWHNVWMAGHSRELARDVRAVGAAVAEGQRPLLALSVVVGVAVLREGSEVVLFLYGVFAAGGDLGAPCYRRGARAAPAPGVGGDLSRPARRPRAPLFAVTTGLITLLAAGLASQAVVFLQQADTARASRRRCGIPPGCGRRRPFRSAAAHTDRLHPTPDGAQLVAYVAVIVLMLAMMRLARGRTTTVRANRCVHLPDRFRRAIRWGRGDAMPTARAAVLRQIGTPMTIETVEVGPVVPGDVLVRIRAASLCHTDLEAIEGALAVRLPAVLGHEAAGEIATGCGRYRSRGRRPCRPFVEPALRPLLLL